MKIHIILIKEFKQNMRNWKANLMMVLFPIIIIIILGAAFSRIFDKSVDLSGVKVLYTVQSSQQLASSFRGFTAEIGKELGLSFEETNDAQKGMDSIKAGSYACYIQLKGGPDEIRIYKNSRTDFEANMVESLMKAFSQRYDALSEVYRANPQLLGRLLADNSMDFVQNVPLNKNRQPGSLDYYAVTMLTLILLYASLTGLWGIKGEYTMKTGNRILCAPIRKYQVLTGKVVGGIAVTIVQALAVILFSKFILKADWGEDLVTVMLIVIAQSIMAISIGTGVGFLIRNEGAASGLLNSFIPFLAFFGGSYVPLSQMGEGIARISQLSPVKWDNDALFKVIYGGDYSAVLPAVIINLAVAAAFIAVSALFSRKEAA